MFLWLVCAGPSKGCSGYGLVTVPASALGYFPPSRRRSGGIGRRSGGVGAVPIGDPFPNVPVHVVKAPGVGGVLANVAGLTDSACLVIGLGGVDRGAPPVGGGGSRPAGVFPLGFGGQGIGPARGQAVGVALEFVEAFEKDLSIVPRNLLDRSVVPREFTEKCLTLGCC